MAIKDWARPRTSLQVEELDEAAVAGFELGLFGDARGRAADVERAHRELRAGLADGLRGDHSGGFPQLDRAAGGEVASVAAGASAAASLARQDGTNLDALDAGSLNGVGQFLVNLLVDLDDDVAFVVFDSLERDAAHHAIAQRLDFDARFENRRDVNAVDRAAIDLADDDVLRHVHEAACEIAGIGGLERRIGQALTRSVRGDEVLQHGEAFAEVGGDGRLDDFAGRLGHQTAHAGKLADLLFRSARAGIRHDVHRIDDAFLVLLLHRLEHLLGDFFGDVAPDGDNFVVAFAVGDRAVEVLLLHLDDFALGGFHQVRFAAGNQHVVNADGDAGARGVEEAQLLQPVEHHDGALDSEPR